MSEGNCLKIVTEITLPAAPTLQCDVLAIKFPRDSSEQVAVGCSDGRIRIFNTTAPHSHVSTLSSKATTDLAKADPKGLVERDPCTAIAFLHKPQGGHDESDFSGQLLATYASGKICRWHIGTKSCLTEATPRHPGSLLALDVCPDGTEYIVCGESTYLETFAITSKESKAQYGMGTMQRVAAGQSMAPKGHTNRVHCVRYHPTDPNIVFSAGWDRVVLKWDKRQADPLSRISGPYVCGDAIDISAITNEIVIGSYQEKKSLQLWGLDSLTETKDLTQEMDPSMIYGCQFNPADPGLVATAGTQDNELRLVDKATGNTVGRVHDAKGFYACSFSGDGVFLAGGGGGGKVILTRISVPTTGIFPYCLKIREPAAADSGGVTPGGMDGTWSKSPAPVTGVGDPDAEVEFDLDPDSECSDNDEDDDDDAAQLAGAFTQLAGSS